MSIYVTKSFFPPKEEFIKQLSTIWESGWITNHGPLVFQLEKQLKEYLDVFNIHYVNNGTVALQIAIKALELKDDVITTPFSYVATTSSLVWQNCRPIYADIDPLTFNIDPQKIENCITPKTTGILATHVFGNPCNIEAIDLIARRYNLKVIYDAAHCFGTKYKNQSIFNFGDISTTSFHATKIFHTAEGGATFTSDDEIHKKLAFLRNFGHSSPTTFEMAGINGKASELHAAMGLSILPYITEILEKRKQLSEYYDKVLFDFTFQKQQIQDYSVYNHSYYPVVFQTSQQLEQAIALLNQNQIFPRRYFYPSLDTLNYVESHACDISRDIAERILCLPLYHDLGYVDIERIAEILYKVQTKFK